MYLDFCVTYDYEPYRKRNYVHFLYLHKENEPKESAPQTLSLRLPLIFLKIWRGI